MSQMRMAGVVMVCCYILYCLELSPGHLFCSKFSPRSLNETGNYQGCADFTGIIQKNRKAKSKEQNASTIEANLNKIQLYIYIEQNTPIYRAKYTYIQNKIHVAIYSCKFPTIAVLKMKQSNIEWYEGQINCSQMVVLCGHPD